MLFCMFNLSEHILFHRKIYQKQDMRFYRCYVYFTCIAKKQNEHILK